jgi:hypothetical protein
MEQIVTIVRYHSFRIRIIRHIHSMIDGWFLYWINTYWSESSIVTTPNFSVTNIHYNTSSYRYKVYWVLHFLMPMEPLTYKSRRGNFYFFQKLVIAHVLNIPSFRFYKFVIFLFRLDINECSSDPCKNGGTCKDLVNAYECTCAAGYDGDNCDNST